MDKPEINYQLVVAILVAAAGIVVRFLFLDIDPPLFFQNTTQALLTDPYNITSFARNKVLFGDWDILDYHRWEAFKFSLSSLSAYLMFSLGGVSRLTANLSAVLLSTGGILIFIGGIWGYSRKSSAIALILLISNAFLIIYGRYPFLENGLLFLSALLFFIFVKYYPAKWSVIAAAILTSLCVLSGKAFGVAIAIPVLLVILIERKPGWIWDMGLYIVSGIISGIALIWLYYGKHYDIVFFYMAEQSTGMYGFPQALTSIFIFFEQLVSFGGQSRFYYFSPILLFLLFISFVFLILGRNKYIDLFKENRVLLFNLAWLLGTFVFLMVFNHRPLRYRMFLMLPLCGFIGIMISHRTVLIESFKPGILKILGILLLCWHLITQMVFLFYNKKITHDIHIQISWYSLIPAVILAGLIYLFHEKVYKALRFKSIVPFVLVVLAIIFQGYWIYDWFSHPLYSLKRANQDLQEIVAPDAFIMGPYSQAMTIDNKLRSFVYMFGLSQVEKDLFSAFPFTHVITDQANWGKAQSIFPELRERESQTRYWVREFSIDLYRCPDKNNLWLYQPTDFERARSFLYTPYHDSTAYYLGRYLSKHPTSLSALTLLSDHFLVSGQLFKGLEIRDQITRLYSDDFTQYIEAGFVYYKVYLLSGQAELLQKADSLFDTAIQLNPRSAGAVSDAKKQAGEMF